MYTVIGGILLVIGAFGTSITMSIMASETSYTWSAPFTDFESSVITWLIISVAMVIGGILTFVFGYINAKNQNSLDTLVNSSSESGLKNVCPKCKTNLSASCTRCPACGTEISND